MARFAASIARAIAFFLIPTLIAAAACAQDTRPIDADRINADKYLQVLLRRPRPGVALDRVYGYHVQNDSLESLRELLVPDPDDADPDGGNLTGVDAGTRQMVWGLIQLQRGRSADAAAILGEAEGFLPDDAACSFYLGRALLAIGQTEKAAAAMERAIERGPARSEALPMFTALGRIYSRAGESEKSLAVWTRLEQLFPGDTRVGGQIARTLADEGSLEEAKARYEKLSNASKKPDDKIAFAVQAAEMQRRMGEPDEALGLFEKILTRLRPGSWLYTDVRNRIEAGFLKSGDYDALADYYTDQLKTRPEDLPLQTRLSRILVTAGRLNEAKTLLQTCVDRAPDDVEVRLTLIDVLVRQNDVAAAGKQFELLAKNDPDNPDHLIRWGQVLLEDVDTPLEKRRDAAVDVWSRLADARGGDAVTLSQIADRMRDIDRSDEAIELYKKAIDVDPDAPQYREYLGEYLHSLKRTDEAIETWKAIAQGDRKDRESLVRLAEVYGTFKQDALALEAWKEASSFDLTFAQELRYATKLSEAKQYDAALARYDIAAKIAETPDEQEQLLKDRIATYQSSGTLEQQIESMRSKPETSQTLRSLALMYGAAGDLDLSEQSIRKAMRIDPESVDVLLVAADIAERQNRFGDAADLFQNLSSADSRFRTNYLQRVANLRIRLGQVDDAMKTCEAIIDANPASPESYQFLARTAFGINRDEQAIAALRRAMSVAPRDNSPRRMLASHFAERFRTDEAVELYWQAFQYETKIDNQINVIAAMAPLYDRKTDLETLIGRIEEINRKDGDTRTTALMTAAAYEAVQDFGAARNAIDQLLAAKPRDVALLDSMVRLSDAADEVEMAAEYQKRITELADTPENRFKLIQYQLDAGTIDVSTALSQRISFLSDPSRLGGMIRGAARRNDFATARAICLEALKSDDSLWDVKLALAQLLMADQTNKEFEKNRELAVKLAREVRHANVGFDAPPPTRPSKKRKPQTNGLPPGYRSNPMYWSQASYQLASMMRVGRYASSQYSYSRQTAVVEPVSYGQARVIAASLIVMNEAIGKTGDELTGAIKTIIDNEFALPDIDKVNDSIVLWEHQGLLSLQAMMVPTGAINLFGMSTPQNASAKQKAEAETYRKRQMKLMWRLAELDPLHGLTPIISMMSQRMMSAMAPANQKPNMDPLTERQLELLATINRRIQENGLPQSMAMGLPSGAGKMMMQSVLAHEFKLAGKTELADQFAPEDLPADASYMETMGAIQFYLQLQKPNKADQLVKQLLPAARRETNTTGMSTANVSRGIQMITAGNKEAVEFNKRHQIELINAVIARWALGQSSNRRSTTLGTGYIDSYTRTLGRYQSIRLRGPLSTRLLDSSLVQQLTGLIPQSATTQSRMTTIEIPEAVIESLEAPLAGAGPDEQKTRWVVAAYARWWANRPQDCYESLVKLCEKYPSDVDVQIERARLASELKQPRVALQALDSFNPLDSKMLVRKEMAAMNLAAEIGDTERAKIAAERLFGMRLDVNTQLALADQLKRLGLKDRADAMLQRTRSGRTKDESTQIRIAQAFLAAGKKESAAEVAYSLFRRLASGRSTQRSNATYYRQQVVSILKSAGRLDPLIERAKRRVETSPKATRPKMELAELYVAAGRPQDADKLWDTLSEEDAPVNAQQMITRAETLAKAKKYDEAVNLFLDAFEKDPQRFSNDFYKMTNVVRRAGEKATDKMFERLLDFPIEMIPSYRMDELARLGSRDKMSKAKRNFIGMLFKSRSAKNEIYSIARGLSETQRQQIPEYREALLSAVCSSDAFTSGSTFWQVRSRGSGGRAYGPLEDIVTLMKTDKKAAKTYRDAAAKALENESQKPTAAFMLALLNAAEPEQLEASVETMRGIIKHDPDDTSAPAIVSYGLLWQAGQVLEKIDDVPAEFLVALYTESKRTNSSTSSSPRYTVDSRLMQAMVKNGQKADARAILVKMYGDVDNSRQNQYNPGYGDYQDLQAYQWIADQMVEMGSPIDALIIYRNALSDPARFERSKRWGGSRGMKEGFDKGVETALKKITPAVAGDYLLGQVAIWEADLKKSPVDLMESSVEMLGKTDSPSSLELAIRKSAGGKAFAKGKVKEFNRRVSELSKANDKSWQLAALHLMTACSIGSNESETAAEDLFQRLPPQADIADVKDRDSAAIKYRELLDLYPVARVAQQSAADANKQHAQRLVGYLQTVARSVGEPSMGIVLAKISGSGKDSIAKVLNLIEAQSKPGTPLPQAMVDQCLRITLEAASAGEMEDSTRALKLALGNGPPLRKLATSGDAFAISAPQSRQPTQADQQLDGLIAQLTPVLDAYSKATGVSLTTVELKKDSESESVADPENFGPITDTMLAIMLPAQREGMVFPYQTTVAGQSYDRFRSGDKIEVRSVSLALAIAASKCGRSRETFELLEKRFEKVSDKVEVATAMVQVASASGDAEMFKNALQRLSESLGDQLPGADEEPAELTSVNVITSQMSTDSRRKSVTINVVMNAVWPTIRAEGLVASKSKKPELSEFQKLIAAPIVTLLQRTHTLIKSDSYTAGRHREIARRIAKQIPAWARISGDEKAIDSYIKLQLQPPTSFPSGADVDAYRRQAFERSTLEMIKEGLTARMDQVFRRAATERPKKREVYAKRFDAHLCMEISRLPSTEQIEFLRRMTFGRSGKEPIAYLSGLVRYELPPDMVRRQLPSLDDAVSLPTSTKEFPVVNSLLMLIDSEAALGQTDSLADMIAAQSKTIGDDADIAAALLKLAVAENGGLSRAKAIEEIRPTLAAVTKRLESQRPAKTIDKLPFPELEMHLALRAARAGLPVGEAGAIIGNVKVFAIRAHRNTMVSAVSRANAALGLGRTAGGTTKSPSNTFTSSRTRKSIPPTTPDSSRCSRSMNKAG